MKVLIISDTHRRDDRLLALIERIKPIDMLIHCGDTEGSEELYMAGVDCHCLLYTSGQGQAGYLAGIV